MFQGKPISKNMKKIKNIYNIPLVVRSAAAKGTCRVMCFSPKSNVTIPVMSLVEIKQVIDTWAEELQALGKKYK